MHMVILPKYSVSVVAETMKKNTSRRFREKFRFLEKVYWDRGGIWSSGYVVSTVGMAEEIISRYVADKGRKTRDKRSLNFEILPPVKAGESIRDVDLYAEVHPWITTNC